MIKHIAIAGNIGTGKSSLTQRLAQRLGWQAYYEDPADNPYIGDFYDDMQRWGFNMQIYFLYQRMARIQAIRHGRTHTVQERTIYEDVFIFTKNLVNMGLMAQRDYDCYANLFKLLRPFIPAPDLLIILRARSGVTLRKRFLEKSRDQHHDVSITYFNALNALYEEWSESYDFGPKLIFDSEDLNFIESAEDLDIIVQAVIAHFPDLISYKKG